MAKNLSLRAKLLSTSALAVAGTFWLGASPALAIPAGSCVTAGSTAITITCSGNTTDQVYTSDANTTVTLNPDANVFVGGAAAIHLDDENASLVMGANSTAISHGNGATGAVGAFNSADATLNGGASITLEQNNLRDDAYALSIQGFDGSNITLNGGSSINFTGGSYVDKYVSAKAVKAFGEKINITLNGASKINVTGTGEMVPGPGTIHNDYYGIVIENTAETLANRNTITLNGGSSINVARTGVDTAGDTIGISSFANADDKYAAVITLSDSSINVSAGGVSDSDKYAGILSVGGADATVTLNNSTISVTGASTNVDSENTYAGIQLIQDNMSAAHVGGITLSAGSQVIVNASGSGSYSSAYGVSIETFNDDAAIGAVTLNGGSSITLNLTGTTEYAVGIRAEGLGAKVTLNGGSSVNLIGTGTGENGEFTGIYVESYATTAGLAPSITLSGGSSVNVSRIGVNSYGSIYGINTAVDGDDEFAANITLSNSSINVTASGASYGEKYTGIFSAGGAQATVTLNHSTVSVSGASTDADGENKYAGIAIFQDDVEGAGRGGLTLNAGSNVSVTTNGVDQTTGAKAYGLVVVGSQHIELAPITLNGGSSVTLDLGGDTKYGVGIAAMGYGGDITLNGGSRVTINAHGEDISSSAKYVGIRLWSATNGDFGPGSITLNAGSSINLTGSGNSHSKYVGITNIAAGGDKYAAAITLNDSSINITDHDGENNKYVGIEQLGNAGTITLNGASSINLGTHYDDVAHANVGGGENALGYVGILSGGTVGPTITLNGTSRVSIIGSGLAYDAKYDGILASGSTGGSVTLNDHAGVEIGIYATGPDVNGAVIGVGLSSGGGGSLTLNDNAHVIIRGYGDAIGKAAYVTGTGNVVTLNDDASLNAYNTNNIIGLVVGGSGNAVALNDRSFIYGGHDAGGILLTGNENTVTLGADTVVGGGRFGITVVGDFNEIHVQGTVWGNDAAIDTSGGNNSSVTLDSARINGAVRGWGSDTLTLKGKGTLGQGVTGFGHLVVNGDYWNLATGSTNEAFSTDIVSGRLAINGSFLGDAITVHSGGSLGGTGTIDAAIFVLAGGTISPGNSPGTLHVVGPVTFNAGSIFDVEIGATAADLLDATGNVTIDAGAIIQPTFFPGADGFVGDIVTTSGGVVTGTFTPGSGAALDYSTPGVVALTAASSSSMNGGMSAGAAQGFTFLDTVLNEAQKSASTGKTLWGTALWSRSTRTAATTSSRGFDQHSNGGAFGGDVMSSGDFSLGLAAGYLDGDAITSGGGSRTSIEGYHAAVYSTYTFGGTYITSAVTGAYQDQNAKRNVFAGGVLVGAEGSPDAWLGGVGVGLGHEFPLNGAFTITPRASLGYQHMARDGYTETGGGTGALALDGIDTDTIRGRVGAELALNIADKNALWAIRPQVNAALAQEWRGGDTTTTGTFRTTNAAFNNTLDSRNQSYLALGAGVDVTVGYGVTAFVNYDGGVGGDAESSGGWRLGARMEW